MRIKTDLPSVLKYHALVIESAARDAGLDFFDVVFELLDAREVNGIAAYGGFPLRYPSWRFGMDYERLQKGYDWGLSKIYELVINNDPTYAYLVRSNSLLEQKLVMAHVYGHADFFKNNVWFKGTDRRMLETMGRHAARVRKLVDEQGQDRVDCFMDLALSLEGLIDPYPPSREAGSRSESGAVLSERRLHALLSFGNEEEPKPAAARFAADFPVADVLGFLMEHAPLERWERELLSIVREEAYYFAPQRITKVANEGWACFWHSKLLTGGLLDSSEIVDFADTHAGATAAAPGQFNPYKLGLALWRHAERAGQDLFVMRRVHNDVSLINAVCDEEFVMRYHGVRPSDERRAREAGLNWTEWRDGLLAQLTNGGQPRIRARSCDTKSEGELVLEHLHDGRDLQLVTAKATLDNVAKIWGRRVELHSQVAAKPVALAAENGKVEQVELSA